MIDFTSGLMCSKIAKIMIWGKFHSPVELSLLLHALIRHPIIVEMFLPQDLSCPEYQP